MADSKPLLPQDPMNITALADRLLANNGALLEDLLEELGARGKLIATIGTTTARKVNPGDSPLEDAAQESDEEQLLIALPSHLLEATELYATYMGKLRGEALRDLLARGLDSLEIPLS